MSALRKVFAGAGLAALATAAALVTSAPANASIIVHDGAGSAEHASIIIQDTTPPAHDGIIIQGMAPPAHDGIIINQGTGSSEQLFPPGPVVLAAFTGLHVDGVAVIADQPA